MPRQRSLVKVGVPSTSAFWWRWRLPSSSAFWWWVPASQAPEHRCRISERPCGSTGQHNFGNSQCSAGGHAAHTQHGLKQIQLAATRLKCTSARGNKA